MLDGLGSEAPHVAANPQVASDWALLGNDADPVVVMFPATGAGLLGTRAKQMRALDPADPVGPVLPAYPAAMMLAVVQLIVVVVAVPASIRDTDASQSVKPALGDVVIELDHPAGLGVNVPVDHVYVEVPVGPAGMVAAH